MAGSLLDKLLRAARIGGRRTLQDADPVAGERRALDRRREPRYTLPAELPENLRVTVEVLARQRTYCICDLSVRGVRLDTAEDAGSYDVGDLLDVHIRLGEARVPATLKIINRDGSELGCVIAEIDGGWREEVGRVLDPISIGKRLREIDKRFVKQDSPDLESRWFQAGPLCDLFIWARAHGAVARAQLFFSWQLVEWTPEYGLRTGRVEESQTDSRHARSELFALSTPPNAETLATAQILLLAATAVPAGIRSLFGA